MAAISNERMRFTGVYSPELLRHFWQPINVGTLDVCRKDISLGEAGSRREGCLVRFYLQIGESDRVAKSRYRVFGCPVAIAACSLLSDSVVGWRVKALSEIEVQPLVAALEPPAAKRGILLLVEDALRAAAGNYPGML